MHTDTAYQRPPALKYTPFHARSNPKKQKRVGWAQKDEASRPKRWSPAPIDIPSSSSSVADTRVNADTLHSTYQHLLHTPSAREIGLTSALMCAACQLTSLDSSPLAPLSSPRLFANVLSTGNLGAGEFWRQDSSYPALTGMRHCIGWKRYTSPFRRLGVALSAVATSPPPFRRHVCSTQAVRGPERVELSAIRQGRDFCANSNVYTPLFCARMPLENS
jgi:hypothetical protein